MQTDGPHSIPGANRQTHTHTSLSDLYFPSDLVYENPLAASSTSSSPSFPSVFRVQTNGLEVHYQQPSWKKWPLSHPLPVRNTGPRTAAPALNCPSVLTFPPLYHKRVLSGRTAVRRTIVRIYIITVCIGRYTPFSLLGVYSPCLSEWLIFRLRNLHKASLAELALCGCQFYFFIGTNYYYSCYCLVKLYFMLLISDAVLMPWFFYVTIHPFNCIPRYGEKKTIVDCVHIHNQLCNGLMSFFSWNHERLYT